MFLSSCSVSVPESVSVMALPGCGHGCCPRVAAGLARGSTVRGPGGRGRFLLPDGLFSWRRLAEAGGEYGDLGFPGDGRLGGGGVREFRACFLRAPGVPLTSGNAEGVQGGAGRRRWAAAAIASSDDDAVTWEDVMDRVV